MRKIRLGGIMVAAATPPRILIVVGKPWVTRKCLTNRTYTMPPTQLPAAARPIATPIFRSSNQLISARVPEQNTIPMPKPVTRPWVSHRLQNAVQTLLVNSPMIINRVPPWNIARKKPRSTSLPTGTPSPNTRHSWVEPIQAMVEGDVPAR
jgi:hypothetical protein